MQFRTSAWQLRLQCVAALVCLLHVLVCQANDMIGMNVIGMSVFNGSSSCDEGPLGDGLNLGVIPAGYNCMRTKGTLEGGVHLAISFNCKEDGTVDFFYGDKCGENWHGMPYNYLFDLWFGMRDFDARGLRADKCYTFDSEDDPYSEYRDMRFGSWNIKCDPFQYRDDGNLTDFHNHFDDWELSNFDFSGGQSPGPPHITCNDNDYFHLDQCLTEKLGITRRLSSGVSSTGRARALGSDYDAPETCQEKQEFLDHILHCIEHAPNVAYACKKSYQQLECAEHKELVRVPGSSMECDLTCDPSSGSGLVLRQSVWMIVIAFFSIRSAAA